MSPKPRETSVKLSALDPPGPPTTCLFVPYARRILSKYLSPVKEHFLVAPSVRTHARCNYFISSELD